MENKNKKLFELHNYLDIEEASNEVIDKILERIPDLEDVGYAGYLEKKWLKMTLERLILDKTGNNQKYSYSQKDWKEIKKICEEAIKKCERYLDGVLHIFLFPTFDRFAIEKMRGVSGFCPWRNTLLIFINFNSQWKKYLGGTIVHELAHALSPFVNPESSIGNWLILEGIAENFKDFIIKEEISPWVKSVSEEESLKIFEEIKNKEWLKLNGFDKYDELFFGSGNYPLWTGYAIGYYLIKKYIEKFPDFDWNELLRKNPREIMEFIS